MSKQKRPRVPAAPPEQVKQVDAAVQGVYTDEMKRRKASAGGTIATGGAGIQAPANTGKTVLGG